MRKDAGKLTPSAPRRQGKKEVAVDIQPVQEARRASQLAARVIAPDRPRPDTGFATFERGGSGGGRLWRPDSALQRLKRRLMRGAGRRGARLAELALRAGLTPPSGRLATPASARLEAAVWMQMARENATLRREVSKLTGRERTLVLRIQRAKARVRALRLRLLQRRLDDSDAGRTVSAAVQTQRQKQGEPPIAGGSSRDCDR
jgi:hypothetical protein